MPRETDIEGRHKKAKTITVDPWKVEKVLAEFPNFSIGVDIILADWIARNLTKENKNERQKEKH